jgi:hypothetical protein
MAWDSANIHIGGVEDQATLVERDTLERVSRVDRENSTMLSFARADAEDHARKVALLEDGVVEERQAWETSKREH